MIRPSFNPASCISTCTRFRVRKTMLIQPEEYHRLMEMSLSGIANTLSERGYGLLGTSSVIDDAADSCAGMVDAIITMAEVRTQVLLLLREIGILTRRVNALEKMLLPDLKARERTIGSIRDEREREEFNRLFLIKRKKNRTG